MGPLCPQQPSAGKPPGSWAGPLVVAGLNKLELPAALNWIGSRSAVSPADVLAVFALRFLLQRLSAAFEEGLETCLTDSNPCRQGWNQQ